MHKECLWGRCLASSYTPAPRCFSLWCWWSNESLGCEISCVRSSAEARSLASFLKDPLYSLYTVYVKWESECRGQSALWMPQTSPLKRLVYVSEKRARRFTGSQLHNWFLYQRRGQGDSTQSVETNNVPELRNNTFPTTSSTIPKSYLATDLQVFKHFSHYSKESDPPSFPAIGETEERTDTHKGHHSTSTDTHDVTFTQNALCYHGDWLHWK